MRTDIKFLWFIYLSQSTQSKVRDFHIALRIQKQVLGLYNEFKNLIPRKKLENVWKLVSLWPWDLCDKLLCCGNSPPHQSIVGRASLPRPHRTFPRKTAKNNTFLRISTSEKKKNPHCTILTNSAATTNFLTYLSESYPHDTSSITMYIFVFVPITCKWPKGTQNYTEKIPQVSSL